MTVDRQELAAMRQQTRDINEIELEELLRAAAAHLDAERWSEAEPPLQRALVADPDHAPTWALVGRLADATGDLDVARAAHQNALRLGHDHRAGLALAQLHASVAEWDEAEALAEWLAVHADDAEVRHAAAALAQVVAQRRGRA